MKQEAQPLISILVAVRNEEQNILHCLTSLSKLNYPQYEVLLGDDQSTDQSAQLMQAFIIDKPHFSYYLIQENIGLAKGKSNVLAQLAQRAKGDLFYFTDADMELPANWLESHHHFQRQEVGIITGFTLVKGTLWFEKSQNIDWALAQAQIYYASLLKIPLTTMGNNMAIRREAYQATGGYGNLPFSITEDFQLFHHILKKNYDFKIDTHPSRIAYTKGVNNFKYWLQQRKRWMQGALQLPNWIRIFLFLEALFFPLFLLIFLSNWKLGTGVLLGHCFSKYLMLKTIIHKTQSKFSTAYFMIYYFFNLFLSFFMLIYYYIQPSIEWKGRFYR